MGTLHPDITRSPGVAWRAGAGNFGSGLGRPLGLCSDSRPGSQDAQALRQTQGEPASHPGHIDGLHPERGRPRIQGTSTGDHVAAGGQGAAREPRDSSARPHSASRPATPLTLRAPGTREDGERKSRVPKG
eukprot:4118310-Alexandrium_andersonii.AAC.1